jgi:uncharacterized protein
MDHAELIRRLELTRHPEGGYFRETFRSTQLLQLTDGRRRSASTAIYYYLPQGARSAWHRVASDEVWHHYDGGALLLHRLGLGTVRLDRTNPQAVVPAGVWQGAEPESEGALCGCTVAPGFDYEDFRMAAVDELLAEFPEEAALIRRLAE